MSPPPKNTSMLMSFDSIQEPVIPGDLEDNMFSQIGSIDMTLNDGYPDKTQISISVSAYIVFTDAARKFVLNQFISDTTGRRDHFAIIEPNESQLKTKIHSILETIDTPLFWSFIYRSVFEDYPNLTIDPFLSDTNPESWRQLYYYHPSFFREISSDLYTQSNLPVSPVQPIPIDQSDSITLFGNRDSARKLAYTIGYRIGILQDNTIISFGVCPDIAEKPIQLQYEPPKTLPEKLENNLHIHAFEDDYSSTTVSRFIDEALNVSEDIFFIFGFNSSPLTDNINSPVINAIQESNAGFLKFAKNDSKSDIQYDLVMEIDEVTPNNVSINGSKVTVSPFSGVSATDADLSHYTCNSFELELFEVGAPMFIYPDNTTNFIPTGLYQL